MKLQGKDWFNHRGEKVNERNKSPIYCNVITIQFSGIENLIRKVYEKYNIWIPCDNEICLKIF